MKEIWAKVLKNLREGKFFSLFSLVCSLESITFEPNQIIIEAGNVVEFNILNKNKKMLNEIAGGEYIQIVDKSALMQSTNNTYLERLKDLFGDKLEIL